MRNGGVGRALARLLRPDRQPLMLALDALPVTVADLLQVPRDHDVPDEPIGGWRAA